MVPLLKAVCLLATLSTVISLPKYPVWSPHHHPAHLSSEEDTVVIPRSYDLRIQLPLSEASQPDIPLFTAQLAMQFELKKDLGSQTPFITEDREKGARIKFDIDLLDHFENVSLVYNGTEIEIINVMLTDTIMEITVNQPILFHGTYTMGVSRYKGNIGSGLYYRDAGSHAAFGSTLYPHKAAALFPTTLQTTNKVIFSLSIVHPTDTTAISTSPAQQIGPIDSYWQVTSFRSTIPMTTSLLAIAVLPQEFLKIDNSYTGVDISLFYNHVKISNTQARELLNQITKIFGLLKQFFSFSVAMDKLDIVVMNEITLTPSIGTIIIPEDLILSSAEWWRLYQLAIAIGRHWIGLTATLEKESEICLQEDLLSYVAMKVTERMTKIDKLMTAHYAKILLTESIFEPGMSLQLNTPITMQDINDRCGLKGVLFLQSLEEMLGEEQMVKSINKIVFQSPSGRYSENSVSKFFDMELQENVTASEVLSYWRSHGGFPQMLVDKFNSSIRLKQLHGNITVQVGLDFWEKMHLWPLPLKFTEFKLPVKLMISEGIHLAPVRGDGVTVANKGFTHFYRVNYDTDSWKNIMDTIDQNDTGLTERELMQLTSDFCYFYSIDSIAEPAATLLRNKLIKTIKNTPTKLPLCDVALLQCSKKNKVKQLTAEQASAYRRRIFHEFQSDKQPTCGQGNIHEIVNNLCTDIRDSRCSEQQ